MEHFSVSLNLLIPLWHIFKAHWGGGSILPHKRNKKKNNHLAPRLQKVFNYGSHEKSSHEKKWTVTSHTSVLVASSGMPGSNTRTNLAKRSPKRFGLTNWIRGIITFLNKWTNHISITNHTFSAGGGAAIFYQPKKNLKPMASTSFVRWMVFSFLPTKTFRRVVVPGGVHWFVWPLSSDNGVILV